MWAAIAAAAGYRRALFVEGFFDQAGGVGVVVGALTPARVESHSLVSPAHLRRDVGELFPYVRRAVKWLVSYYRIAGVHRCAICPLFFGIPGAGATACRRGWVVAEPRIIVLPAGPYWPARVGWPRGNEDLLVPERPYWADGRWSALLGGRSVE